MSADPGNVKAPIPYRSTCAYVVMWLRGLCDCVGYVLANTYVPSYVPSYTAPFAPSPSHAARHLELRVQLLQQLQVASWNELKVLELQLELQLAQANTT